MVAQSRDTVYLPLCTALRAGTYNLIRVFTDESEAYHRTRALYLTFGDSLALERIGEGGHVLAAM